jgi:hypothetical protein
MMAAVVHASCSLEVMDQAPALVSGVQWPTCFWDFGRKMRVFVNILLLFMLLLQMLVIMLLLLLTLLLLLLLLLEQKGSVLLLLTKLLFLLKNCQTFRQDVIPGLVRHQRKAGLIVIAMGSAHHVHDGSRAEVKRGRAHMHTPAAHYT